MPKVASKHVMTPEARARALVGGVVALGRGLFRVDDHLVTVAPHLQQTGEQPAHVVAYPGARYGKRADIDHDSQMALESAEYSARMAVNVARSAAFPRFDWLTGYRELLRTLLFVIKLFAALIALIAELGQVGIGWLVDRGRTLATVTARWARVPSAPKRRALMPRKWIS